MQTLIEWARMDGYGGYVWSVFLLLIVVVSYEAGRLTFAQRRLQRLREFN